MIFNFKDTTDAKTLDGHGAEYFFPKSGGTIDGDVVVKGSKLALEGTAKAVGIRAYDNGTVEFYDYTNAKNVFRNTADGTNTFNGTASGNLPLSGGGTVSSNNDTPVTLKSNTSKNVYQRFVNSDGTGWYFGFDEKGARVVGQGYLLHTGNMADYVLPLSGGNIAGELTFQIVDNGRMKIMKNHSAKNDYGTVISDYSKDNAEVVSLGLQANLNKVYFKDASGSVRNIHHDGNSAKTVISDTAPSDTTALWIDTSA